MTPTYVPSVTPSYLPSITPTFESTTVPTYVPSVTPIFLPSNVPSLQPFNTPVFLPDTLQWEFLTGFNVQSSPAIGADGSIYFGSGDNYIYAITPSGTLIWKYLT